MVFIRTALFLFGGVLALSQSNKSNISDRNVTDAVQTQNNASNAIQNTSFTINNNTTKSMSIKQQSGNIDGLSLNEAIKSKSLRIDNSTSQSEATSSLKALNNTNTNQNRTTLDSNTKHLNVISHPKTHVKRKVNDTVKPQQSKRSNKTKPRNIEPVQSQLNATGNVSSVDGILEVQSIRGDSGNLTGSNVSSDIKHEKLNKVNLTTTKLENETLKIKDDSVGFPKKDTLAVRSGVHSASTAGEYNELTEDNQKNAVDVAKPYVPVEKPARVAEILKEANLLLQSYFGHEHMANIIASPLGQKNSDLEPLDSVQPLFTNIGSTKVDVVPFQGYSSVVDSTHEGNKQVQSESIAESTQLTNISLPEIFSTLINTSISTDSTTSNIKNVEIESHDIIDDNIVKQNSTEIELQNATLESQIHDQVALLAALIDRQHSAWLERLVENKTVMSEPKMYIRFFGIVFDMIKNVLPQLQKLANISKDREESAYKVNVHFKPDHFDLQVRQVLPEKRPSQKTVNKYSKKLSALASGIVKLVLTAL